MLDPWTKGRALRAAIGAGLAVSSVAEHALAVSGRRKRTKTEPRQRPVHVLAGDATEAGKIRSEQERLRAEAAAVERDVARFMLEQQRDHPLDAAKRTVFLVVTSGQAVRSFLLTEVIDRLLARFNVVVITPYAYDAAFLREHRRPGLHVLPWFTRFKSRFTNVFQYYLIQSSGSPTHKGWLENLDRRARSRNGEQAGDHRSKRFRYHSYVRRLSVTAGKVLGARGWLGLYNSYFASFVSRSMLETMFDAYRPSLVISTTAHHNVAWPLGSFARGRGVKTLACVLSWDNCTTKATLDPSAEHCAVWSEEMEGEVHRYFPYLECKTIVAGAPMFDMYHQDHWLAPREKFLRGLGLDPELPVVFYATNTPAAMPDEPELIAKFWRTLSRTSFGGKVSLLVRLHPADKAERYKALRGQENLVLTVANERGGNAEDGLDAWIPDRPAMVLLLNSVKHAALSINVASTMSLESFAAEVPTVNVAFRENPEVEEKFLWNFDMYHTSEHYRALIENGAVDIARSMDELVAQTIQVLDGGHRRGPAMRRTLAQKVDYRDGASSRRFAEIVAALANEEEDTALNPDRTTPAAADQTARTGHPAAAPTASRGTWRKQLLVESIWFLLRIFTRVVLAAGVVGSRLLDVVRRLLGRPVKPVVQARPVREADLSADPATAAKLKAAVPAGAANPGATVAEPEPERPARHHSDTPPAGNRVVALLRRVGAYAMQVRQGRAAAERIGRDIEQFAGAQGSTKLHPDRPTVFLVITCGQAIRNFLLSDFYSLMAARYNLVILSPYAYSDTFRTAYQREGVHVLPWLTRYRPKFERLFLYHLMQESGSGTHQGWLKNLKARAQGSKTSRYAKQHRINQASNMLGRLLGRKGMLGLYHSYMVAMLPKGMFAFLFEHYRPALVISTAVHHSETWPLTYYARRYGAKTMGTVLSWDNTTTKPALDPACDVCAVWSPEMAGEVARHFPYLNMETRVTGSPLFDMYYNRRLASDRATFLTSLGLPPDRRYVLYTTNTPAATSDEHLIVRQYWEALSRSPLAGKVSLLIRLHPKQERRPYAYFDGVKDVAVTLAGAPVWSQADRWIPDEGDMRLLLNSMMHAAVSVNIASTMSLESFALNLPTINVAMQSSEDVLNPTLMWSFDMFHTSDHYKAIVENGAVDVARSIEELVAMTAGALEHGARRQDAMRRTLEQKAAYADGTSAARLVQVVDEMLITSKTQQIAELGPEPDAHSDRLNAPHSIAAE